MTAIDTATAGQLDAAILELLRLTPGECTWWSDIRDQLPPATFWAKVESLTRLIDSGQVHTVKIGGRDLVSLAIALPARSSGPSRRGAA